METDNSDVSQAEEIKVLANEAFKAHKYAQAIGLYTQAIELNGQNAVYWANRAFAHTKLEEYGSAIQDASKAIEIDPKYSKGYYRRGAAYLSMGKFKEALKDFQQSLNSGLELWQPGVLPPALLAFEGYVHPVDALWHVAGLGYAPPVASEEILKTAAVLHFSGPAKPWLVIGFPEHKAVEGTTEYII